MFCRGIAGSCDSSSFLRNLILFSVVAMLIGNPKVQEGLILKNNTASQFELLLLCKDQDG